MIMEAEKSHSLSSARWKTRKTGGIIQPKSKDLRNREGDGVSLRPKACESGNWRSVV